MNITRSRIKAIGKKLRDSGFDMDLNSKDLDYLTNWRDAHGPSLNYLLRLLEKKLKENNLQEEKYSLSQRLKRIYSINLKLARF